jgi:hypothetical protein
MAQAKRQENRVDRRPRSILWAKVVAKAYRRIEKMDAADFENGLGTPEQAGIRHLLCTAMDALRAAFVCADVEATADAAVYISMAIGKAVKADKEQA